MLTVISMASGNVRHRKNGKLFCQKAEQASFFIGEREHIPGAVERKDLFRLENVI